MIKHMGKLQIITKSKKMINFDKNLLRSIVPKILALLITTLNSYGASMQILSLT
jgi:hypothetical protein